MLIGNNFVLTGILQVSGVKEGATLALTAAPIPVTQRSVVVTSANLAQLFTPTSSMTGSLTIGPMGVSSGTPIIPVQRQLVEQGECTDLIRIFLGISVLIVQ